MPLHCSIISLKLGTEYSTCIFILKGHKDDTTLCLPLPCLLVQVVRNQNETYCWTEVGVVRDVAEILEEKK